MSNWPASRAWLAWVLSE